MISDYFVCVGAQKASTTWLFSALGRHPEIFVTPVKEIHYFDHVRGVTQHLDDRRRRARFRKYLQRIAFDWPRFGIYRSQWDWYRAYMRSPIDDAWYEELFRHRSGKKLAGEATPEYAPLGRDGFSHIARLAPRAKAIFIMRNPVTQAWSQYLHFAGKRGARGAAEGPEGAKAFWASNYSAPFRDYSKTIDDLHATFGKQRVTLLFHEEIHADRLAALRDVCDFLGVRFDPHVFGALDKALNPSRPEPMPAELRQHLMALHRPTAEAVLERVGSIPPAWRDDFSL